MDRLVQDLRFAIRSLRGSPLLVFAATVSLGLGIGASAAIFSAVDTFMFKPLEFEDSDRLVNVWSTNTERGWTQMSVSAADFRDWRRESSVVDLAAHASTGVNLATEDGAIRLTGVAVTPGFFEILRVAPRLGRTFAADEGAEGGARVAILSNEVWQQTFGGDPDVVGRTLPLDGEPTQIVGIMPEGFIFGQPRDLWLPLRLSSDEPRGARRLAVVGRIRSPSTLDGARAELGALAARLTDTYPDSNTGVGINVLRVQDDWFDEGFVQGSAISSAAVLFVLLIACSNVANLLLARGADREREMALRAAIGAGRWRILRQLLTESLLLALVGGLLGLGVAHLGIEGIRSLFPPFLPGVNRMGLDARTLGFAGLVTAMSAVLFGLAPALQTSATDLRHSLVDGGRGGTGRRGGKLRSALVVGEIGLSAVLLIAAVLLVKSFTQMRTADMGFDVREVATMRLTLPEGKYPTEDGLRTFQEELLARVTGLPGIDAAALTSLRPMSGNTSASYGVVGEAPPEPGREPAVSVRSVSPDYFAVMGMRQVSGRAFLETDRADTPPVVVVNERFAARHWEGRSPLGERVRLWDQEREIVGVVEDTREWGPEDEPAPLLFAPATQRVTRGPFLMLRTAQDVGTVAAGVREAVRAMDPDQAVYGFASLEQVLQEEISGYTAMTKILGVLALIAFLLSAVGVYGVLAYSVARRTQEMGIRQSLGADRAAVRALVVRQGLAMAGIGVLGGVAVALATTRLLTFFLVGVSPFDPMAFASVPAVLLATALAASWLPAVRATRVDPIVALRSE